MPRTPGAGLPDADPGAAAAGSASPASSIVIPAATADNAARRGHASMRLPDPISLASVDLRADRTRYEWYQLHLVNKWLSLLYAWCVPSRPGRTTRECRVLVKSRRSDDGDCHG